MTDPFSATLEQRVEAAKRSGLSRPWEIIFDRTPDGAVVLSSVRIVDARRRLIARFMPGSEEHEALTLEAMQLIVEAVNAA